MRDMPIEKQALAQSSKDALRRGWGVTALLLVMMGLIFHKAVWSMVTVWMNSATYGHGFLIAPVAIYLAWDKRHLLAQLPVRPSLFGVGWIFGAGLLWLVGELMAANVLQHLAVVGFIQGAVLAIMGVSVARVLMFPLGYLFFMVPFGDFAIQPLQQLTADYSTALLRWSGVPVFHENWIIVIPGGTFLVAEACAGVRFLIASLALGALISGTMFQSWAKRSFYMLLSVLVPILANVVRAYGIVMIAHLSNFELAVGVDHLVYGFVFLSFVMLLLFGIAWMMRDPLPQGPAQPLPREEGAAQSASMGYILGVFTAALFISLGLRLYAFDMMRGNAISPVTLHAPAASGDWRLLGRAGPGQWQGSFVGADGQATWLYSNGDHRVSLFVAYYGDEAPGKELIAGRNNLTGSKDLEAIKSGITKEDVFGYGLVPSSYLIVPEDTGARRYVWYWYVLSDDVTARQADVKVASLAAKLSGGRAEGMIVAVSMLVETPEDIAIVGDFLNAAGLHESLNAGGFAPFVTTDIQ